MPPSLALHECLPGAAPALDVAAQRALAEIVPLLACGEEAAAATFRVLRRRPAFDESETAALALIEAEERVHDQLLTRLRERLPPSATRDEYATAARAFHRAVWTADPLEHLARIAAIDAGVCGILARLTARGGPLAADPALVAMLRRIQRDEAGHVAVARGIVKARGVGQRHRASAAFARAELGRLVAPACKPFSALGVDPNALSRFLDCTQQGLL